MPCFSGQSIVTELWHRHFHNFTVFTSTRQWCFQIFHFQTWAPFSKQFITLGDWKRPPNWTGLKTSPKDERLRPLFQNMKEMFCTRLIPDGRLHLFTRRLSTALSFHHRSNLIVSVVQAVMRLTGWDERQQHSVGWKRATTFHSWSWSFRSNSMSWFTWSLNCPVQPKTVAGPLFAGRKVEEPPPLWSLLLRAPLEHLN